MAGHYALPWRVGITFFVEEGFQIQRKRLHFGEKGRTHTYFVIPDCRVSGIMAGKHQIKEHTGQDKRYFVRCGTALGWFLLL